MRFVNPRTAAAVLAMVLLTATLLAVRGGDEARTVTAEFDRAVAIYPGSEVRILGVRVGEVLEVVPEGESVRVRMSYDAEYDVPANAKAVIVTPTLVSDRFIQLTPAYDGGKKLADGAVIEKPDTDVPVELDRIYSSLEDLSLALGPNGVNKNGTLDHLLDVGAKNLEGKGKLANRTIRDMSRAAETFGNSSGDLFATVRELGHFTRVLAKNDKVVRGFMEELSGASEVLAGERQELQQVLAEVSRSVEVVERFVKDNRGQLVTDVEKLTKVVKTVSSERDNLAKALRYGPVGLGNLTLMFDARTGTVGGRIGVEGNIADADGFLCSLVAQAQIGKQMTDLACNLFKQLLEPVGTGVAEQMSGPAKAGPAARAQRTQATFSEPGDASLTGLMGGGR